MKSLADLTRAYRLLERGSICREQLQAAEVGILEATEAVWNDTNEDTLRTLNGAWAHASRTYDTCKEK